MNGTKWALGVSLIALSGGLYFSQAQGQGPEGGAVPTRSPAAGADLRQAQGPEGGSAPSAAPGIGVGPEGSVLVAPSNKPAAESAPADFCQCVGQGDSSSVKRIEQALNSPLHSPGLDFADTPLRDVADAIQSDFGIPIQLDRPAFEEAGIGTDSPVTINLHNISLRSALRVMLKQCGITFIIRDEVLLITTNEVADKQLVTCVYNVQGIVDDLDPKSMASLIEAIMGCVATDSWAENGGNQADAMPLRPGLLVVSQTPAIQEEVRGLLMKIRKMREQVPITKGHPISAEPAPKHSSSKTSDQPKTLGGTSSSTEDNPFAD